MPSLLYFPFSPFCRKVRLVAGEKGIDLDLHRVEPWTEPAFRTLNPAGTVPVYLTDREDPIAGSRVIVEYLEETSAEPPLLPGDALRRAEIRGLAEFYDETFFGEVTSSIFGEKVLKRIKTGSPPDTDRIRAGRQALHTHLLEIGRVAEDRGWLTGSDLTLADLAAAAQISCLDYIDAIAWADYPLAADWYARIKSRPSFRPLLADKLPGIPPAAHYADLDF